MPPHRSILLLMCLTALPLLLGILFITSSGSESGLPTSSNQPRRTSHLRALFSFQPPSALFPPSAIISLTDDNSTFFLARPAAFGPLLPSEGLSGPLWAGPGFGGEDVSSESGLTTDAPGELGCSDVPGWEEGRKKSVGDKAGVLDDDQAHVLRRPDDEHGPAASGEASEAGHGGAGNVRSTGISSKQKRSPSPDDGTDDHLHHPLPDSSLSTVEGSGYLARRHLTGNKDGVAQHADIQSLQESAEISGRVVLLRRGGCGFLEKVKWAQRRGGVALIVGDDTKGGGLVTMYARGDTSNVTIPALFTSYTTAHLLSSLMPSEDDKAKTRKPRIAHDSKSGSRTNLNDAKGTRDQQTFTTSADLHQVTSGSRPVRMSGHPRTSGQAQYDASPGAQDSSGWVRRMLSKLGFTRKAHRSFRNGEESRRPPSSGRLDWVLAKDLAETDGIQPGKITTPSTPAPAGKGGDISGEQRDAQGDGFMIGVQDWRDPDLLGSDSLETDKILKNAKSSKDSRDERPTSQSGNSRFNDRARKIAGEGASALEGGIITPGSGEYMEPGSKGPSDESHGHYAGQSQGGDEPDNHGKGWFNCLSRSNKVDSSGQATTEGKGKESSPGTNDEGKPSGGKESSHAGHNGEDEHEGLWVTLTPASPSTSPFFDTLLILVVSPLVTLTVVYCLLVLRSRIRRRAWRAPKSVVDKLPVRTYHTMPPISSPNAVRYSTTGSSSPTSPLLQSRPSQSAQSGALAQHAPLTRTQDAQDGSTADEEEKARARLSDWSRGLMGQHIECAVCLEEYVDGVSRVMSLPCGHEFHADCM